MNLVRAVSKYLEKSSRSWRRLNLVLMMKCEHLMKSSRKAKYEFNKFDQIYCINIAEGIF